ncbi:hypothetical protein [Gallaecimonas sp. GXIMD4217]
MMRLALLLGLLLAGCAGPRVHIFAGPYANHSFTDGHMGLFLAPGG